MKLRYSVASALAIGVFATLFTTNVSPVFAAGGASTVEAGNAEVSGKITYLRIIKPNREAAATARYDSDGDVFTVCSNIRSARVDVRMPTGNNTSEHLFFVRDEAGRGCTTMDDRDHNLIEGNEFLVILESAFVNDTDRKIIYG